jgi:hypothetical protein
MTEELHFKLSPAHFKKLNSGKVFQIKPEHIISGSGVHPISLTFDSKFHRKFMNQMNKGKGVRINPAIHIIDGQGFNLGRAISSGFKKLGNDVKHVTNKVVPVLKRAGTKALPVLKTIGLKALPVLKDITKTVAPALAGLAVGALSENPMLGAIASAGTKSAISGLGITNRRRHVVLGDVSKQIVHVSQIPQVMPQLSKGLDLQSELRNRQKRAGRGQSQVFGGSFSGNGYGS